MSSNPDGMTKRGLLSGGAAALAVSLVAPDALAQNYGTELDHLLHKVTSREDVIALEKRQSNAYRNNSEVVYKGDVIHEFYGIRREEVDALPGHHPMPDIYRDLKYKDEKGTIYSCCHGNDCRPAIIRGIGNGLVAVGLKMFDYVLFFKLQLADTKIFSNGSLLPGNEEFLKHKSHACVVGGAVRCIVLPSDG